MMDTDSGDMKILVEPLTKRELEILTLLAEHQSNNEIASHFTLALSSVKWYVRQIFSKLGVNDRHQVISRARELGLLPPETQAEKPEVLKPLPTGTVTFLFSKIEDSTSAWERDSNAAQRSTQHLHSLMANIIQEHAGILFKTDGDVFQAAFGEPAQALQSALAIQYSICQQRWEIESGLKVSMSLHCGPTELVKSAAGSLDYAANSTLNRAARLVSAGHGEQILISGPAAGLLRDDMPEAVVLKDLGEHHLQGLSQPERIYQVVAPGLVDEFPELKALSIPNHNLPSQLTSFIGRENDILRVKQLLASHRLVTLTGSGGVGKTRLALEVGIQLLKTFQDGVWLVELAPLSNPQYVIPTIASIFKVPEQPGRPLLQSLLDFLRHKVLLLIFDNCEHLLSECAPLIEELLKTCPELRILATSQEALDLYGEIAYQIPILTLPEPDKDLSLDLLIISEAVRLFIDRARQSLPSFAITPSNAPAIAQICKRLDGIPLALELAAARVKLLRVDQIATRLDDAFHLLAGGSRTALPKQQTLHAAIDWSYNLLSEPERILLRRLSVFAGGWPLEAAETICCFAACSREPGGNQSSQSAISLQPFDVLDLLSSLASKSIVNIERELDQEPRYRLLEMIRQYGLEKLNEAHETQLARDQHLAYYLSFAERAEPKLRGPDQIIWLNRLVTENDNLREALQWSLTDITSEGNDRSYYISAGLRLSGALWMFWELKGLFTVGRTWLDRTLANSSAASSPEKAKALSGAGTMAWHQGNFSQAATYHEASLSAYQEIYDTAGIAFEVNNVAVQYHDQALYDQADDLFNKSLAYYQDIQDAWGIGLVLKNLGSTARNRGDPERASVYYRQCLAPLQKAGDQRILAILYLYMGEVAQDLNDPAEAIRWYKESLSLFEKFGERTYMVEFILRIRGDLALLEGNLDSAVQIYRERLQLCWEMGDKGTFTESVECLAKALMVKGNFPHSVHLLSAAYSLRSSMDIPLSLALLPAHHRMVIDLREKIGDQTFDEAWAVGQTMASEGWGKILSYLQPHLALI